MIRFCQIWQAIFFLCLLDRAAASISMPGCPEMCGNVTIPYPFGIGSGCSANSSYAVTCQNSTNGSQFPFLTSIDMEVLKISVRGALEVNLPVSPMNCSAEETTSVGESINGSPFTISPHYNTFINLGCRNSVWLRTSSNTTIGGCTAMCEPNSNDTSCNGLNCCQTFAPPDFQEIRYTYQMINPVSNRVTCGYAFVADMTWLGQGHLMYSGLLDDLLNPFDPAFQYVPVVLDWVFEPASYSMNSECLNSTGDIERDHVVLFDEYEYGSWKRQCFCSSGFEGNPFLDGGCVDIDECSKTWMNHCGNNTCTNTIGGFSCDNPSTDNKEKVIFVGVGSGLGALLLLVGAWICYRVIRRRIKANQRQKFFKRNGGLLLEQQLTSSENRLENTQLFGSRELEKATDNYNKNRVLGGGGQGTVYKGMLTDGRIVAIKRSKTVDENDIEDFINEVMILSQINHRNIVKLLGCCLETEVPILVYEFIPNGTLSQLIHEPGEELPLSWEMRLRIATEVAGALSYLHSSASTPVYHRDIKSTNILLDDKYRAKVADFGTSRSFSVDQTHLTTRVLGTFGYLDPEYFQSSQFTDKSDVYSFGVLMAELLTGEKAVSSVRVDEGRSLVIHFLDSMDENVLLDILDERVVKEATKESVLAVAQIAKRCLHLNGKRRPTMREVAVALGRIEMMKEDSTAKHSDEEKLLKHGDEDKDLKHSMEEKHFCAIDVAESNDFWTISESMHFDSQCRGEDSFDNHPLL